MMELRHILATLLYSYPLLLCVVLLVSGTFFHGRQATECVEYQGRKRSRLAFAIVWYLQVCLSASLVR